MIRQTEASIAAFYGFRAGFENEVVMTRTNSTIAQSAICSDRLFVSVKTKRIGNVAPAWIEANVLAVRSEKPSQAEPHVPPGTAALSDSRYRPQSGHRSMAVRQDRW